MWYRQETEMLKRKEDFKSYGINKLESVLLLQKIVFKICWLEFLSKLAAKLITFVRYKYHGKMWQSTTEILKQKENSKRDIIWNKVYKKAVCAPRL